MAAPTSTASQQVAPLAVESSAHTHTQPQPHSHSHTATATATATATHTATHTATQPQPQPQPHTHSHTATQPHTQPHTMTTCQLCRPRYNSVLTRTTSEGIVARVRCVHAFNPAALWEVALEVVGVHIKLTDVAFMPKLQHTPVELRHLQHTRCVGLQDSRPAHSMHNMAARVGRHSRTNSRPRKAQLTCPCVDGFPSRRPCSRLGWVQ